MEYTVLIQPQHNGNFEAVIPAFPMFRSTGTSEEEALAKLRSSVSDLFQKSKITSIEVAEQQQESRDPWLAMAGMWRDDPTWEEYQGLIKKHRKRPRARK